jgi:hypothetical protein
MHVRYPPAQLSEPQHRVRQSEWPPTRYIPRLSRKPSFHDLIHNSQICPRVIEELVLVAVNLHFAGLPSRLAHGRTPFTLMDAPTFLVISPSSITLYTYEYAAAAYFLKNPICGNQHEPLGILNIFGPTMTGTHGSQTRL